MSTSLQLHELQHSRLPCPSLSPWVFSNSSPLGWWCHPNISSFVIPFWSWPQPSPAPQYFPMSWLFASGGQNIGASASDLPMNIQDWFPLGLTGLILLSKGFLRVFSNTTIWKHQFFSSQSSLWSNSHIHMWLLKSHSFDHWTFIGKVMSLVFNMLFSFITAFLRSKASFNFVTAVNICSDFGAQEYKVCQCFHFLPFYLPWSNVTWCHDLSFLNVEF